MPRKAQPPRLWLRKVRRDGSGRITHPATYFILDRGRQIATGIAAEETDKAASFLSEYIAEKQRRNVGKRDPDHIPVADVLSVYLDDVVPNHSRPLESEYRIGRLLEFFGSKKLSDINGPLCRAYAKAATTDAMARRDLEELRAAINHHRREGLHDRIVSVVLPPRRPARERWLDRSEVATLLWTAWRRPKCKQLARFILVALYTGRRSAVICGASFRREQGRTWLDVDSGKLWPPERARITNKRNPPAPIADRLLPHLRRWRDKGHRYVVEWGDHSSSRVDRTMKGVAKAAGLSDVTPRVLRHTAATWLMQQGIDMLEAGWFLGMTTRTLESTYAHFRPDHLTAAKAAFSSGNRQRIANDSSEPSANEARLTRARNA
jgi:integrase